MSVSANLGGLLFRRLPGVSFAALLALVALALMFWGASVISYDLAHTLDAAFEEKIVTLTAADQGVADTAAGLLSQYSGKVTVISQDEVKEMLGSMDPQLRSLLLGVGSEAENLVPTMVTFRGVIESEAVENLKKTTGVMKIHEKKAMDGPYRESLKRLHFQLDLIRFLLWVASMSVVLLFTRILSREFHPIAQNLEHWGVPSLRIKFPLAVASLAVLLLAHALSYAVWESTVRERGLGLSMLSGVSIPQVWRLPVSAESTLLLSQVSLILLITLGSLTKRRVRSK
jgi:hypothetical protein